MIRALVVTAFAAVVCVAPRGIHAAEKLDPATAAIQVDSLLDSELFAVAEELADPAPRVDDETFLRRVSLDLIGGPPSAEEVARFSLDPSIEKRTTLVQRLLADARFGRNWGRYFRDVVMYRRSDERGLLSSQALEDYLADEFNKGTNWGEIARSFITATGNVRENGETALFMAQMGEYEDVAAEASRILMGVQIQCAQCHDHPTDRWKRTQFHELAAFFPRTSIRPIRVDGQQRGFELVSSERGARRPGAGPARGRGEHFMSDLDDPAAQGTLMQPVFFATGRRLDAGASDMDRRKALSGWLTSDDNEWFSKAFVNRIWAELVGEGFYEPIDDLGPDRTCSAPESMELLADQFAEHHYDIKWLFETIAGTEAYQRESRPRRTADGTPFVATCTQRLRGDQLYASLVSALDLVEPAVPQGGDRGPGYLNRFRTPRSQINQIFGFDPSDPRDEVAGSIPQALTLMNSTVVNRAIDGANRNTMLGRLLAETKNDEDVVVELYLKCLSREPDDAELAECLAYVGEVGGRVEAFEDVLWSLLNSTEFLHKR